LRLPGGPHAVLSDPDGRTWSRLSLLASVDRTDIPDESFDIGEPEVNKAEVNTAHAAGEALVEVRLRCRSTAWSAKSVLLRCFEDRLEIRVCVEGSGVLSEVRVLGGRAVLANGACGTFRSSIEFASVFNPTPTEPINVVRPAFAGCTLGVVGDASPGRLHGIFSPPPLYLAFGRKRAQHATDIPAGRWLTAGVVAGVEELRFTEMRYSPLDGGYLLELDYDGHTTVTGSFVTPAIVLRLGADPWRGLAVYRDDLIERGLAPTGLAMPRADWWAEPIFCGWGAQCARSSVTVPGLVPGAAELARQDLYDEWLRRLEERGVIPGTVVIDDRWQSEYGTAVPDPVRWPDLRGWIERRHAAGQRVLLWWKAWDPAGLPPQECVTDQSGRPVAADPGSPAYLEHLTEMVSYLLGADGLNADGFKIDFTQRTPSGRGLRRPGAPVGAPWGIAALYRLLHTVYSAAKAIKPDSLVITHTPHPGFADVCDMVRLNDILDRDPSGKAVSAVDQLAFRHAVVAAVMPDHLIDTDQWPVASLAEWRSYVLTQSRLGVPALYYAELIDRSGEALTDHDLALVATTWREYRERRGALIPRPRHQEPQLDEARGKVAG